MSAGLRQQGFQNAQQMAANDASATNQARAFNAGNLMQARGANQNAALSAAGIRSGAAGQLGNMANLGFGMANTITNNQMTAGGTQQDLIQRIIDAGNNQYRGFTGQGQTGLATLLGALGGVPVPQTTTSTNSPGLLNIASTLLGL
jgi:hypothetical protein